MRRNAEILTGFMGKQKSVVDGLSGVARFFELIATSRTESAKIL